MLDNVSALVGVAGGTAGLLGVAWRGTRGLHKFVSAVTDNTSAVARLTERLQQHIDTTTTAYDALDQRVTTLERHTP